MMSLSPRRLSVDYLRGLGGAFCLPVASDTSGTPQSQKHCKVSTTQSIGGAGAAKTISVGPAAGSQGESKSAHASLPVGLPACVDFTQFLSKLRPENPLLEVDDTCALLENTEQATPLESYENFGRNFTQCLSQMAQAGCFVEPNGESSSLGCLSHGLATRLYLHPPVYTCEQATKFCACDRMKSHPHSEMKNLFLKDKKKNLFLVSALVGTEVKLNSLKLKGAASGGLSFASNDLLLEVMGLLPGSVTPFGLLHDREAKRVTYYLDKNALSGSGQEKEYLGFHPNACNATLAIHRDVFRDFIEKVTGHEMNVLE